MRDDELRRLLRQRNPWWQGSNDGDPTAWIHRDPILSAAQEAELSYTPNILDDVVPPGLVVLRGPRRVGKSVVAKRLIARLCREGGWEAASRIVYLAADGLRAQDLRRAFTIGRELSPATGPRTWVIDEVCGVDGWTKVVKELRDNSELAWDAVVLTGSSSSDLAAARSDLGPGRTKIMQPFRVLLPMTFRDFLKVNGVSLPFPDPLSPDLLQSPQAREAVRSLSLSVDALDLMWQKFLECGGFPRAVADAKRNGRVSDEFSGDIRAWLADDVAPKDSAESVIELLDALERRSSSPLDLGATAEFLRTTRDRLRVRINRLVHAFGAYWCPQQGLDGKPAPNSQSKLYLIDPLLSWLPHLLDGGFHGPDFTRISESQIGFELARSIDRFNPDRLIEQRAVLYSRTGNGNEVDFASVSMRVAGQVCQSIPIESKWVSRRWRSEALVMRAKYHAGIIATKDVIEIDDHDVWAVPAPILALLLN